MHLITNRQLTICIFESPASEWDKRFANRGEYCATCLLLSVPLHVQVSTLLLIVRYEGYIKWFYAGKGKPIVLPFMFNMM